MNRTSLDWSDRIAVSQWLGALRETTADAQAITTDMLRPPRARELGHALHRQRHREIAEQLAGLLAYAAVPEPDGEPNGAAGAQGASPLPRSDPLPFAVHGRRGDRRRSDACELDRAIGETIGCIHGEQLDEAVAALSMTGVLFLALIGTPGERAEVDSPLVLVLRAIRETIDDWSRARSGSTRCAEVPFAALDLLGHRVGAAIEIARRGGLGTSSTRRSESA